MRGAVSVLLAAALWGVPVAQADAMIATSGGGPEDLYAPEDLYVCIDPSPEDPQVFLSATDCASGTPDTATIIVSDSSTGTEIIVHVKACLEGGCAHSVCLNGECQPECSVSFLCIDIACRLAYCTLPW